MTGAALVLADLATAIAAAHQAAGTAARTALAHAIRCGELLIQAKAALEHGAWIPWLQENCALRPRTARAYMQLARALPKLSAEDRQRVAGLAVRDAIAQLAQQSRQLAKLPAALVADVLDQAEDARLRDPLVNAINRQKARARPPEGADNWIMIELPALPPPDRALGERIAAAIEASGLAPIVIQETLNKVYCDHQNRHQLSTPYDLPAELVGVAL